MNRRSAATRHQRAQRGRGEGEQGPEDVPRRSGRAGRNTGRQQRDQETGEEESTRKQRRGDLARRERDPLPTLVASG